LIPNYKRKKGKRRPCSFDELDGWFWQEFFDAKTTTIYPKGALPHPSFFLSFFFKPF
jgi:hypothetical protein